MPEDKLKKALEISAPYGKDIDIEKYEEGTKQPEQIDDLEDAKKYAERMEDVGIITDEGQRAGTIMFIDNGMSHCSNKEEEGVELLSTSQAIKKYDWVKDYMWKAVNPEKDKYTAKTALEESDGYFIRVKAGYHAKHPVQTCMMLKGNKTLQNLHNIIIVEEGASLEILTGCTTSHNDSASLHVGVSEIYVKDNASLQFSMIHDWGKNMDVRPRTGSFIGANARFTNNYVILNPVGSVQTNPIANLNGEGASTTFNTMCMGHKGSEIDTGGIAVLNAKSSNAEIVSRNINQGGFMTARGRLIGNAKGAKAHLECRSLVLAEGGNTIAIPELEAHSADVEMTHEAAVGKIAQDQIEYLMSRGLDEDSAISMIVKGFLTGSISGLPATLQKKLSEAVELANLGS